MNIKKKNLQTISSSPEICPLLLQVGKNDSKFLLVQVIPEKGGL